MYELLISRISLSIVIFLEILLFSSNSRLLGNPSSGILSLFPISVSFALRGFPHTHSDAP